ncbi:hypothetical protein [Leifsonia poae]|uniref:hypothetical protein n=1 Tax=Leifsonia poae TaxID=110933 RepID=UPI003D6768D5
MNDENQIPRIAATVPARETPRWAVLQRRLFDMLDGAWREFAATYCEPDGRLKYAGRMFHRDGVDDFYEPFFNWPVLYRLGGSADLLPAVKHHWAGVTAQMTEFGFVKDEYELGYDWFHQGSRSSSSTRSAPPIPMTLNSANAHCASRGSTPIRRRATTTRRRRSSSHLTPAPADRARGSEPSGSSTAQARPE